MSWLEITYAVAALAFQLLLLGYFVVRFRSPEFAYRWGWIVYAAAVPAAVLGALSFVAGAPWAFGAAGFIYLAWGVFGFLVDVVPGVTWRAPVRWAVFIPYVVLYLATAMFYWWPLALVHRPLWYVAGALFAVGTVFNIVSHRRTARADPSPRRPPGTD